MTPEGRVKARVKKLLSKYSPNLYQHWPVLNGMGCPTLDVIGCFWGRFFAIEVKAGNKRMTQRQELTAGDMMLAHGRVFLVNDESGLDELEDWLERVDTREIKKRAIKST